MPLWDSVKKWGVRLVGGLPATSRYKPNPINTWGMTPRELPPFTFLMIRFMLWDPIVRLGLAMRAAPIHGAEFAYKDGDNWVPGIRAKKPEVAAWVHRQLTHIWMTDLRNLLKGQIWGWVGAEIVWKLGADGHVHVNRLLTRSASDTRLLQDKGLPAGVRFKNCAGEGNVDLPFPKAFWHPFFPEDGSAYGIPILRGCYSPWADKYLDGGALDVRRLFMHKDAYGGMEIGYEPGVIEIPSTDGSGTRVVPNADIARQIEEQATAGNVISYPMKYDAKGNPLWKITRAQIPPNPTHILQYPKDLDVEILRGMEIADDVLTSDKTGAWAGKLVPQQAFYSGLDSWLHSLVGAIRMFVLEPGIMLNCGRAEEFEVTTKPLAEQALEQQKQQQPQGGQQGGENGDGGGGGGLPFNPFGAQGGNGAARRMAIDREQVASAIVGEGVLGAAKLVEATRLNMDRRLRLATRHAPKGGVTIGGQEFKGGEFIPNEVYEKATPEEKAAIEGEAKGDSKIEAAVAKKIKNTWMREYGDWEPAADMSDAQLKAAMKRLPKYVNDMDEEQKEKAAGIYREQLRRHLSAKSESTAEAAGRYREFEQTGKWPYFVEITSAESGGARRVDLDQGWTVHGDPAAKKLQEERQVEKERKAAEEKKANEEWVERVQDARAEWRASAEAAGELNPKDLAAGDVVETPMYDMEGPEDVLRFRVTDIDERGDVYGVELNAPQTETGGYLGQREDIRRISAAQKKTPSPAAGRPDPAVSATLTRGSEQRFLKDLSDEERTALEQYKGDDPYAPGAAIALNAMLRKGEQLSAQQQDALAALDSAMRKAPRLKAPTTLYRGTSSIMKDKGGYLDFGGAFISTSVDREQAEGFAGLTGDEEYVYEISVPKGFVAMPTSHFHSGTSIEEEAELVLPRGTSIKVIGREGNTIKAEVVGGQAWMMRRMAIRHAPKGGVSIGGERFEGGEFIPKEVYESATPAQRAKIDGHAAPGRTRTTKKVQTSGDFLSRAEHLDGSLLYE